MILLAPQDLVTQKDHQGLADYYKNQAQELRERAKTWDVSAESYEVHGDPHGKVDPKNMPHTVEQLRLHTEKLPKRRMLWQESTSSSFHTVLSGKPICPPVPTVLAGASKSLFKS